MTCRLLGQQRIALPSQEFITLRLSVLRVGQGATDRYRWEHRLSNILKRRTDTTMCCLPRPGKQRSARRESSVGLYEGAVYELRKHCYGQVSDHRTRNFNGR